MLRPSRLQLIAVVAALAVAAVFVTGAFAGKGGSGGSGAGGGSYSPSLGVVWPYLGANTSGSTAPVPYVVSGCGYNAAYGGVTIVVTSPESISFSGQIPDAGGCISLTNWSTQGTGSYTIKAYQTVKNRDVVVATAGFSVS